MHQFCPEINQHGGNSKAQTTYTRAEYQSFPGNTNVIILDLALAETVQQRVKSFINNLLRGHFNRVTFLPKKLVSIRFTFFTVFHHSPSDYLSARLALPPIGSTSSFRCRAIVGMAPKIHRRSKPKNQRIPGNNIQHMGHIGF